MEQGKDCSLELTGLVVLLLALLISMSLNAVLCIRRRRASSSRDKDDCCYPHMYGGEGPSQEEGHSFQELNRHGHHDNSHNHHEQLGNPIYGNINTDRSDICYEMATRQHARDHVKTLDTDLNYASLDLKLAKKRKRKQQQRRQQQDQSRHSHQDHVRLTSSLNSFLEVDGDLDARLPHRDASTMVSHSSIYLNSQQIAQETEEMEREQGVDMEREDGRTAGPWRGEGEGQEGEDGDGVGNGTSFHQQLLP